MGTTVIALISFVSLLASSHAFAATCADPKGIRDFVQCQNKVVAEHASAKVSDFIADLVKFSALACTRSGSSAQPAFPQQGDLRCFMVFKSGATVSVNLVEDMNDNHIEVSQSVRVPGVAKPAVVLAHFQLHEAISLGDAFASPDRDESAMRCATCHRPVGRDTLKVDGFDVWALEAIQLNSTLRGTIPRNGQIAPRELDGVLRDLLARHRCQKNDKTPTETCRRIQLLLKAPRRAALDSPVGSTTR